jgi:hypothetical protein
MEDKNHSGKAAKNSSSVTTESKATRNLSVNSATLRPWRVDHSIETEPLSGRMPRHRWSIFSNAPGPDFIVGEASREANGNLIVRAVNFHEELIELLSEFLKCGVEFDDERMNYVVMQIDRQLLKDARAALAAVEAQERQER